MLEIVMPGIRRGEAKMNSSSAYRGHMCYIAGVDKDGDQLLQLPYSSAQAGRAYFPVNKLYFEEYYNDTSASIDKITAGEKITYYEGGEYITDRVNIASFFGAGGNGKASNTTYWAVVEHVSSADSHAMNSLGASTAISGGGGLKSCFVSTGAGGGWKLYGSTTFSVWTRDVHIGYAVGIYGQDSANARVRFRCDKNLIYGNFV